jgi:PAS domain S-box-containing protein
MTDDSDRFTRQLEELNGRLETLRGRITGSPPELLEDALAELSTTVEELRVADEELRQQGEQLALSHDVLANERRRYVDLFEFAPDGYLVTDASGVIREINQAGTRLLSRPAKFCLGKPLALYVSPEDLPEFRTRLLRVASDDQAHTWQLTLLPLKRPPLPVECTVDAAKNGSAQGVPELRWRLQDITDRKEYEAEILRSRETLRELSARLEAVREEERARIAREVHDELGSALTAIKMDVAQLRSALNKLDPVDARLPLAHAESAVTLIDSTMHTVRRIATELRPAVLDDFGLVAAIDSHLNEFEHRTGISCRLHVAPGSTGINNNISTNLFRILQEILTNIIRHAKATRLEVRLSQEAGQVLLSVRDDGRGIAAEDLLRREALGILGMRERLELLGGSLNIEGVPGRGTLVEARLPLAAQN